MFTGYRDSSMIVSIKHTKSYKLSERLDKQGTGPAKCALKKRGALQEQVQSGLRTEMCPFAYVALQT